MPKRSQGVPHVKDIQPHIIVSYRKAIFAGEPLTIEVLNLPIANAFTTLRGTVVLRDQHDKILARLPFALRADFLAVQTVSYPVSSAIVHDMLDVQVELAATGTRSFEKTYCNLPPIPVITDGQLSDPLYFSVPLHRLYTDQQISLCVDGSTSNTSIPLPRILSVQAKGAPNVGGVSYLRSGAIINDPTTETAIEPVVDNWPHDPTRHTCSPYEYYGALVQYADGSLAYSRGLWIQDPGIERTWADYHFEQERQWSYARDDSSKGKLFDRTGHGYHGTMKQVLPGKGSVPAVAANFR